MRVKSELFTVNGEPLFAPDEGVSMEFEDLDSADSGRTESGDMFRIVVRYKVGKWGFEFSSITGSEMREQEALFPDEPDFIFGHPSRLDPDVQEFHRCYRSKYGISYYSARDKLFKNYKFNIIEC